MLNTNERIIKHKVGLLNLAEELGNVSRACQVMGLSRDTFYRYKQAVEDGGVESLLQKDRRKPNPTIREPWIDFDRVKLADQGVLPSQDLELIAQRWQEVAVG